MKKKKETADDRPAATPVNVLMVDDHPENLLALEACLAGLGLELVKANSGREALKLSLQQDFALILMDVQMPEMDGFETATLIRGRDKSRHIPIVFVTAVGTTPEHIARGYSLGAVDYIIKPYTAQEMRTKVLAYTNMYRQKRNLEVELGEISGLSERVNILLVDDEENNLLTLSETLLPLGENIVTARSGREALKILMKEEIALILMDIQMPEMDGFETMELIGQNDRLAHVPVLFVTAIHRAMEDVTRGYALGALDYIFTPYEPEILRSKIRALVNIHRQTKLLNRQLDEIRRLMRELTASEAQLREANATLEERVRQRTAALQDKNNELNTVMQQFLQAAKLATTGELASSIAHELNNPLATVSLRIESLLAKTEGSDPRMRELEIIGREVERMGSLVNNLLQFSRRGQPQISTVDVCAEIEKTFELIEYHLRKNKVKIMREFAPEVPCIHADRQQLRQLFLNLFTNAGDAMPQGGTLTVRVTALPEAKQVSIEIADTGVGIPAESLPKVTEAFFTTKPEGKGTGLGLAICRRIAQEHRGTLDITSEGIAGKGTTVRIALPLSNGNNAKSFTDE